MAAARDIAGIARGLSIALAISASVACSVEGGTGTGDSGGRHDSGTQPFDAGNGPHDVVAIEVNSPDVQYNPDAFFAMDPPPMTCGADGAVETDATVPGGTPECPSDKNREGCPCDTPGTTAPCWPGLRVNRDHGVCHDGMTTCMPTGDVGGRWGACTGYTLPTAGATLGAPACMCFSSGTWAIANLSPCFYQMPVGTIIGAGYSTLMGTTLSCPPQATPASPIRPGTTWTTDSVTVDCSGQWHLCYTIKAFSTAPTGTAMPTPAASDCTMAQVCTDGYYSPADAAAHRAVTFPPLPAWQTTTAAQNACAVQFGQNGGYGEMSVTGTTGDCQSIDNGSGAPYVFNRAMYCPLSCNTTPNTPACMMCQSGGSGMF